MAYFTSNIPRTSTPTTITDNRRYNVCEWGRISIFDGTNYADFQQSCKYALAAAKAWNIANGLEPLPLDHAAQRDWDDRCSLGVQIIVSSVELALLDKIDDLILEGNLYSIWSELANFDRARSRTFVASVQLQWANAAYENEPISDYVSRLESIRHQIKSSDEPISDHEVLRKILRTLPNTPALQFVRSWVTTEQLSLSEAILSLESYELSGLNTGKPNMNTAATALSDVTNNPSGRRGPRQGPVRGRGRGNGRAGSLRARIGGRPHSKAGRVGSLAARVSRKPHPTSRRADSLQARVGSKPQSTERRAAKDECLFCRRKGHYIKDCHAFKAAQQAFRNELGS